MTGEMDRGGATATPSPRIFLGRLNQVPWSPPWIVIRRGVGASALAWLVAPYDDSNPGRLLHVQTKMSSSFFAAGSNFFHSAPISIS